METTQNPKTSKNNNHQILKILQALKQASQDLHKFPNSDSPGIKALLQLEHESESILSHDIRLSALSSHLTQLKTLITNSCTNFVTRRVNSYEISRVAGKIELEIQAWIDREFIDTLTRTLRFVNVNEVKDDHVIDLIEEFEERVSKGFDRELQDLILRKKVFNQLETILCGKKFTQNVRETCGFAIAELIKFNKDVFVGQVLMSKTVHELISLASTRSIQILCILIKLIKSPIVDELESNHEIPKLISLLSSEDFSLRAMALDCVLEIGYFGRKEVIDGMFEKDLVKKLVELQKGEKGENVHLFVSCVARFAVQLEVGEGLRQREKRALKVEILKRVREANVTDAEAATIIAEVLWGASP